MYGLGCHEWRGPHQLQEKLTAAEKELKQWRDVFGHLGTPDECGNE